MGVPYRYLEMLTTAAVIWVLVLLELLQAA